MEKNGVQNHHHQQKPKTNTPFDQYEITIRYTFPGELVNTDTYNNQNHEFENMQKDKTMQIENNNNNGKSVNNEFVKSSFFFPCTRGFDHQQKPKTNSPFDQYEITIRYTFPGELVNTDIYNNQNHEFENMQKDKTMQNENNNNNGKSVNNEFVKSSFLFPCTRGFHFSGKVVNTDTYNNQNHEFENMQKDKTMQNENNNNNNNGKSVNNEFVKITIPCTRGFDFSGHLVNTYTYNNQNHEFENMQKENNNNNNGKSVNNEFVKSSFTFPYIKENNKVATGFTFSGKLVNTYNNQNHEFENMQKDKNNAK
nr:MAG: hypothetical protein [Metapenaeopsis lamellata majanivirus]